MRMPCATWTSSLTLINWYAADALGLIVIVPILFTVRTEAFLRMFQKDQVLKTLLYVSTVVVAILINRLARSMPLPSCSSDGACF